MRTVIALVGLVIFVPIVVMNGGATKPVELDAATELRSRWALEELEKRYNQIEYKDSFLSQRVPLDAIRQSAKEAESMAPGVERQTDLNKVLIQSQSGLLEVSNIVDHQQKQAFDRAPKAVLFLVDVSGSMMATAAGETQDYTRALDPTKFRAYAARKLAEKRLDELKKLRPDAQFGLCLFDDVMYPVCEVGSKLDDVREQMQQIETSKHRGGTDLNGRYPLSRNGEPVLLQAARYLQAARCQKENILLVVITDEDVDPAPNDAERNPWHALFVRNIPVELHKVK